jgi:hypothetical protein
MIRNVVVGRLRPGVELSAIEPALAAIRALNPAGIVACHVGTDLRLREKSWDFVITADFVDEASYQAYDAEEQHNTIRREMFAPLSEEIARIQFRI